MVVMYMHKRVKARQWIDGIVGDDGVRFRAMRLSPGRSPSLSCSLVYSLCRKGVCYGAGKHICDPSIYCVRSNEVYKQASGSPMRGCLMVKRDEKDDCPLGRWTGRERALLRVLSGNN